MAFDVATATIMTRSLSSLLAGATDAEIQNALTQHAVPRVRLYLLAATDPNGNNIFYTVLSDLADSTKAVAAEALVDEVMDELSIADGIRRIAAALACAWLIIAKFSVVESQQKQGNQLEKSAMADLQRLTSGHLLHTAVTNVAVAAKSTLAIGSALYIATDIDPATVDTTNLLGQAYSGAQLPYVGAPDAGKISVYINGTLVEAVVLAGDAPITVANRLIQAFNLLPLGTAPNVNLVASEVVKNNDRALYQDLDPTTGLPVIKYINYVRQMARITIMPKDYDAALEVAVASVSLSSRIQAAPTTYQAGVTGFVYGTEPTASALSFLGPYAIAVELKSGKVTALTNASGTTAQPLSDCLFFVGTSPDLYETNMTYQVNGSPVFTVKVPPLTDAAGISELLAKDMAANSETIRLLGAVRPSCLVTVNGTPLNAPGLEFVAFGLENELSRVVFNLLSVPTGITFGVVPNTLVTAALFDERPKSVVVTTSVAKHAGQGNFTTGTDRQANVIKVNYIPTPGLQNILTRIQQLKPININYSFPF